MMSSTLSLFIALCVLVSLLASFVVIIPWLRLKKEDAPLIDNQLLELNIDVYHSRLTELAADKAAGSLNQKQYHTQKTELERQLLDAEQSAAPMLDSTLASKLLLVLWAPLLAGLGYMVIDDRSEVYNLWQAQEKMGVVADDLLTGKIDELPMWAMKDIGGLFSVMQINVHKNPTDANRWMRLANAFLSFEANESALEALSRAYRLSPADEEIAMAYAQMNFFAQEGNLDAYNRRVISDILQANPQQEEAQMLMVMGEARAGNYQAAQEWIGKMRGILEQKSGDQSDELADLDDLNANMMKQAEQASQGVNVFVSISPSLLPLIQADDVLFVAIRAATGGAPYAAKRIAISDLQQGGIAISLSDLDAMMPERTLHSARLAGEQLVVTARVSHSGNVSSQSGDLSANPVVLDQEALVNIEINQQVP